MSFIDLLVGVGFSASKLLLLCSRLSGIGVEVAFSLTGVERTPE